MRSESATRNAFSSPPWAASLAARAALASPLLARQGGPRRRTRPARAGTQGRARHAFGIACRAGVLRGAFVVKRVTFAVPGSLDTPTGGYAYDRRIIAELRQLDWDVDYLDIGEGFPAPDEATRSAHGRCCSACRRDSRSCWMAWRSACCRMSQRNSRARIRWSHSCIIHLALESGLTAERADALRHSERAALAAVREVVVTSPATAKLVVSDYGVSPERVTVARPGNDPVAPIARRAERRAASAVRRRRHARKGFRRPRCCACDTGRHPVAADDRRRPHAESGRSGEDFGTVSRNIGPVRPDRNDGRRLIVAARQRSMPRPTCSSSPRASKVRHGLHRGAVAWPARDRDHGRRDPRDNPGRRRIAGASRRRCCTCEKPCATSLPIRIGADGISEGAIAAARTAADLAGIRNNLRCRAGPTDMSGFSVEWLALREEL